MLILVSDINEGLTAADILPTVAEAEAIRDAKRENMGIISTNSGLCITPETACFLIEYVSIDRDDGDTFDQEKWYRHNLEMKCLRRKSWAKSAQGGNKRKYPVNRIMKRHNRKTRRQDRINKKISLDTCKKA